MSHSAVVLSAVQWFISVYHEQNADIVTYMTSLIKFKLQILHEILQKSDVTKKHDIIWHPSFLKKTGIKQFHVMTRSRECTSLKTLKNGSEHMNKTHEHEWVTEQ